jgi:hypothetical protein
MAQKDLIPLNKRSKEDQFRIKQMGGIKSGEVRRKKRDLKERFKLGLEIFTELKARELKINGNEEAAKIVKIALRSNYRRSMIYWIELKEKLLRRVL